MSSKAFTLAEVLITLGITGIVASLTLPNLIGRYKEKEYIAGLKKAYTTINQALLLAINEYGTVDNWCERPLNKNTCSQTMKERISKYLKVTNVCTKQDGKCFSKRYNNQSAFFTNIIYEIKTTDKTAYNFTALCGDGYERNWCKTNVNDFTSGGFYYNCGYIYVDINGPEKPNETGKDAFVFKIFKNGIRPGGISADGIWTESFKDSCLQKKQTSFTGRLWCAGWALHNENMDYLHCDDLSWKGKTKCK